MINSWGVTFVHYYTLPPPDKMLVLYQEYRVTGKIITNDHVHIIPRLRI